MRDSLVALIPLKRASECEPYEDPCCYHDALVSRIQEQQPDLLADLTSNQLYRSKQSKVLALIVDVPVGKPAQSMLRDLRLGFEQVLSPDGTPCRIQAGPKWEHNWSCVQKLPSGREGQSLHDLKTQAISLPNSDGSLNRAPSPLLQKGPCKKAFPGRWVAQQRAPKLLKDDFDGVGKVGRRPLARKEIPEPGLEVPGLTSQDHHIAHGSRGLGEIQHKLEHAGWT